MGNNKSIFNTVEIEINHGCNRSCSYCPNSITERIENGDMSQTLYENILSQLKNINFSGTISYSFYNEPLLSNQLENFISLARHRLPKIKIVLYSNGTLLNLARFKSLSNSGVDNFIITKHENIKNYVFDKTLYQLTNEEKNKVIFKNYTDLILTNRGGLLKHITHTKKTDLLPCMIPTKMLTISVKGNVIPCFEDYNQKNQMGNVSEQNIEDIWNSDKYQNFRNNLASGLRHNYEACNSCNRLAVL